MSDILSGYQSILGASHMSSVIFTPILQGTGSYSHFMMRKQTQKAKVGCPLSHRGGIQVQSVHTKIYILFSMIYCL